MTIHTGLYFRHFGSLLVPLALVCSCGPKSNPVSFVDSYSPTLTSAKGTAFQGDYYPLVTGYSWTISGTTHETGSATVSEGSGSANSSIGHDHRRLPDHGGIA